MNMRLLNVAVITCLLGLAAVRSRCADVQAEAGRVPKTASSTTSEPAAWRIPPRPADETKDLGALEEITKMFRSTYANERARVQRSQGIVILLRFSGATLFRNGEIVETVRVIPSEYHNLRYAAHVPFMLFLKLRPLCGSPLESTSRMELEQCVETLKC